MKNSKVVKDKKNKENVFINYEYKELIKQKNEGNLYEIISYKDSDDLKLSYIKGIEEDDKIGNYFPQEEKGIIIYEIKNKKRYI